MKFSLKQLLFIAVIQISVAPVSAVGVVQESFKGIIQ